MTDQQLGRAVEGVDVIPLDAEISDEGANNMPAEVLPFELPTHLHGLEALVIRDAHRLAGDPADVHAFERAARIIVQDLELRVSTYRALGKIATNPNSLPARLAGRPARRMP